MSKYENPSDYSAQIDALQKNIRVIRERCDTLSARIDVIIAKKSRTPQDESLVSEMCDEIVELEEQEDLLSEHLARLLDGGRGALH